ncbi:MAG: phosphatidylglycerol lysyltransferase domain-containing protein [Planctomycetota bacterium]|jgi:phosphatidylglycerol lysyltransferase
MPSWPSDTKPSVRIYEGDEARALDAKARWDLLSPWLTRFGDGAFSYATLQSGLSYFVDDELGYLAYVVVRHRVFALRSKRIVLADPVCDPAAIPELVRRALVSNPRMALAPTTERCATALREIGFKANCLGYEPVLNMQTYDTNGNWRDLDVVRRARNEVRRRGLRIVEQDLGEVNREALETISRRWLRGKPVNDREIWIYARQPRYEREEGVRAFTAWDAEGTLAGFACYDPMYEGGDVVGYSANISRCDEERYHKLSVAIHMTAIDKFREEGRQTLNLCIAPFDHVKQGAFNDDGLSRAFYWLLRNFGGRIYNFDGLSFYKGKLRGDEQPVYFVSNGLMPANDLYLAFLSSHIVRSYFGTLWRLFLGASSRARQRLRRKQGGGKAIAKR